VCSECGHKAVQWTGKCQSCHNWNTLVEEVEVKNKKSGSLSAITPAKPRIQQINRNEADTEIRMTLADAELNRVLGGGIVKGSLVLVGGKPGIGKSTLLLQLALKSQNLKTLYYSGEESFNQVNLRARRLGKPHEGVYFVSDTSMENLASSIEEVAPDLVIVDSIQTLQTADIESSPGNVSQIRECTNQLLQVAKHRNCSILIVGHITKEGFIAGPKVLEHMVDVVLYFDDTNLAYRFIKSTKNRFGTTNEVGIYEMTQNGLSVVDNPSNIFLDSFGKNLPGVAISSTIEGVRPILVEFQALVSNSQYGTPQRTSTGVDSKRLSMLLAVLEKHCGLQLNQKDVFLNVAGGLKINDPSTDLAIIAAIASSYFDQSLKAASIFCGEVGLTGEVRQVKLLENRLSEANRIGIQRVYTAIGKNSKPSKVDVLNVETVQQLIRNLFTS